MLSVFTCHTDTSALEVYSLVYVQLGKVGNYLDHVEMTGLVAQGEKTKWHGRNGGDETRFTAGNLGPARPSLSGNEATGGPTRL